MDILIEVVKWYLYIVAGLIGICMVMGALGGFLEGAALVIYAHFQMLYRIPRWLWFKVQGKKDPKPTWLETLQAKGEEV